MKSHVICHEWQHSTWWFKPEVSLGALKGQLQWWESVGTNSGFQSNRGQKKGVSGRVKGAGPLSDMFLQFSHYKQGQNHSRKHFLHYLSLPPSSNLISQSYFPSSSIVFQSPFLSSRYLGRCDASGWHPEGMSHCAFHFKSFSSSLNLLLHFFRGREQARE